MISLVEKMGGSGSQLKNLKNWWKFGDLEKFTCIRYWSTDSRNFKSRPKSEKFCHFLPLLPNTKPSTEWFLFFWYTVDPWHHVGAFFKKIQIKFFFIKIIVSPLGILHDRIKVSHRSTFLCPERWKGEFRSPASDCTRF